jgi:hypothetical protein
MAARTNSARTASARKAVRASWAPLADDPVARRARTAPARLAAARKVIGELEAQSSRTESA